MRRFSGHVPHYFLIRAITLAVAMCGALAVFELGLRAWYRKVERITGVTAWRPDKWGGLTYYWDKYHPTYGWTNLPGYRSDARVPFEVSINAQGLRAKRSYELTPPADKRRIALFGDSCAFGEEVDDDQTVPVFLEQRLVNAEVMNFGVHGYGLGQMGMRLEHEGFAFQPDHVVILYLTLDFTRDPLPEFSHPKPVFGVRQGRLKIDNVPVPEATRQPWWIRNCFVAAAICGRTPAFPSPPNSSGGFRLLASLLADIKVSCERRNVPLTIVHITDFGMWQDMQRSPEASKMTGQVRRVLRESQIDVLDLVSFLGQQCLRDGAALCRPNGHWSPEANDLIAGQIASHLAQRDASWQLIEEPLDSVQLQYSSR